MAVADPASRQAALAYGTTRGRWVIAASVLGSGIASLDATVVNIALPSVGRTFRSGLGTLQWVVTGYSLTLAAFLLLGGVLGDRYGRRRIFSLGLVWFALASAACGLAPDAALLVAARVVQGVGGAMLTPASLAILQSSFRAEDRGRAIGAWSGLGGLATAAGPLLGGYLIAAGSWRWVFFINLPVAAAVFALTARHVPESHDPNAAGRVDGAGAALAVVVLSALTYGLIEGPTLGWSAPAVMAALAVAAVGAPAFFAFESSRRHPMLPLDLFRGAQFRAANAVTFVVYAASSGALFLLPVELQVVSGYSALESGLALLPVTAVMLAFSARSAALAGRIGPRLQMSVGPLLVGAGLLLLTRATDGRSYVSFLLPAVAVFAAGLAVTVAPLTATALDAAPAERAGVASAVNNVVARSAALLAVAVLPLLAGLTGGSALGAHDFARGFRVAMVIAGVVCAAGGVLSAAAIRNPRQEAASDDLAGCRRWSCPVDGAPLHPAAAGAGADTPQPRGG